MTEVTNVAKHPHNAHLEAPDWTKFTVRFRLNEFLVERGIVHTERADLIGKANLTEAARMTGVHWVVLERMANNRVSGLQFDNLAKLCLGLKASPNDLIEIVERNDGNKKDASPTPD